MWWCHWLGLCLFVRSAEKGDYAHAALRCPWPQICAPERSRGGETEKVRQMRRWQEAAFREQGFTAEREQNPHILSDERNVSPSNELWDIQQQRAGKTFDFCAVVACFPVQYTVKNTQCRNKVTLFALEYKQLWDHTAILHQQSSL